MITGSLRKWVLVLGIMALLVGVGAVGMAQVDEEAGGNRTEANGCAGCHFNPGMAEVVADWELSQHGRSFDYGSGANTYCASCKAPLNWDPEATRADNDPVAWEDWQDVTCGSCHPPHELRVAWGTPIGVVVGFDPFADEYEWEPIYDTTELCLHCHSGARHLVEFQGFGKVMFEQKGVTCVDCHMADVPNSSPDGFGESHTWMVRETLPYSCGVGNGNCHDNKTVEWAAKQIDKQKIHGKEK